MAGDAPSETATLPEDRDVAVRELWRRVFGSSDHSTSAAEQHVVERLSQVELRLDRVDDRLNRMDDSLSRVETRLAVVETKMSTLETAATRLDAAVVRLQENSRTDFRLTFGAIIATAVGLAGVMAKGFHWF